MQTLIAGKHYDQSEQFGRDFVFRYHVQPIFAKTKISRDHRFNDGDAKKTLRENLDSAAKDRKASPTASTA